MKRAPAAIALTLFLGLFLGMAAFFVVTQPVTPLTALASCVSVILFALPSYLAIVRLQGARRGVVVLAALGAYALAIESSALATGFPYGDFTYTNVLGNKVFGLTPWTVAFAYPPILLLAFTIARRVLPGEPAVHPLIKTSILTAVIATGCDLVLDPAAVGLEFWYWDSPGFYYGVPLVNFAGWLLTGFVGGLILGKLWGRRVAAPAVAWSGLATLWFWTAANAWLHQWWPVAVGLVLSFAFYQLLRRRPPRLV